MALAENIMIVARILTNAIILSFLIVVNCILIPPKNKELGETEQVKEAV